MTAALRRRPLAVALLIGATLAVAACSGKNVRKPAELQDIDKPEVQLGKAWTASAGNGGGKFYSELTLALEPDALFAADVKGRIYAFDPKTGHRIWRAPTKKRVISGPTVNGEAVLAGTMDGEIVAVKRADGAALWSTRLSSEALSPPASDGSRVFMRTGDGKIYGLDAQSGAELWSADRTVPNLTLRGLSPPAVLGGRVYVGLDNGRVLALRTSDGQVLWEQVVAAPTGRNELERITDIDAPLLSDGGELYAASFGGEVACLDDDTGQILWRRSVKSYSGMARTESAVVVTDEAGTVWGLDPATGAALWKNEDLKYRQLSAPAVFKGWVVAGDYKGYLHWFDPKDGHLVARIRAGSDPIRVAPVAGEDLLYVLNAEGDITAVRIR
ncbi:outer membrane protein assembly factor BamB [Solimonas variicoloris]|uniref:outer membrane protein assembly factor BamB n=1 Tax=Solimonas variicoloris TaxID=254408 RepID=UPI00037E12B7|nr:outer membrane protein assembly factor BamB [Solimonas variicoloris]